MNRGEFIGFLEEAHDVDNDAESRLRLRLLEAVAASALEGREWASVLAKAAANSQQELSDSWGRISRLSDSSQMEGFQTDEAHHEQDGYRYHQLTVFWGSGKTAYEEQGRLGKFDGGLLDIAA